MTAGRGSTGQKSVRFSSSTSGMPSLSVGAVNLKSTYQGWRGGGYEYESDPDDAHESKYTRYLLTSPNSVNSLNFEKLCKISIDTTPPSPPKTPAGVTTASSAVRLVSPAVGRMIGTATRIDAKTDGITVGPTTTDAAVIMAAIMIVTIPVATIANDLETTHTRIATIVTTAP